MSLVLNTPPATPPVPLAEAKLHVRDDSSDNDTLILGLVDAATALLDGPNGILNRCIISQSWFAYFDAFPTGTLLRIDLGPVLSLDAFEYLIDGATWVPVLATSFVADKTDANLQIVLASGQAWPTPIGTINSVRVRFTAGYGVNPTDVPADIRLAIKMMVAHWYENRGVVLDDRRLESLPMAVEALLARHRRTSY